MAGTFPPVLLHPSWVVPRSLLVSLQYSTDSIALGGPGRVPKKNYDESMIRVKNTRCSIVSATMDDDAFSFGVVYTDIFERY